MAIPAAMAGRRDIAAAGARNSTRAVYDAVTLARDREKHALGLDPMGGDRFSEMIMRG
jgi:hypothetical protein